jgi:hypothetical protein
MTEAQFQAAIVDLARLLGFKVAHFRAAQTSKGWRTPVAADGKGFPDLVLAKPGRLVFIGLKSAAGKVSAAQRAWIATLASSGAEVHVLREGATSLQDVASILQHPVGGQMSVEAAR